MRYALDLYLVVVDALELASGAPIATVVPLEVEDRLTLLPLRSFAANPLICEPSRIQDELFHLYMRVAPALELAWCPNCDGCSIGRQAHTGACG